MNSKSHLLHTVLALALSLSTGTALAGDAAAKGSDPAAAARGAAAWAGHCKRCHNLRAADEKQDYEWDISVNHMRVIANIPGDTSRDIKAFLKASN